jgi:hypothetical protein
VARRAGKGAQRRAHVYLALNARVGKAAFRAVAHPTGFPRFEAHLAAVSAGIARRMGALPGADQPAQLSGELCRFSVERCQNITAFGVNSGYGVAESGIINRGLTMKKFLIATAAFASVAMAAPAFAADIPVKAPPMLMPALYNWTGCYIGAEGGAVDRKSVV